MTQSSGAPAAAEPLNKLQSCVNNVLISIGRTFRDNVHPEARSMQRQKQQRTESLSTATAQFHEALDEIEGELIRAREVLERDLSKRRTAREERERALDASRQAAATQPSAADAVPTPVSMKKEISQSDIAPDTIMNNDLLNNHTSTNKTPSPSKPIEMKKEGAIITGPLASTAPSAAAHTSGVTAPTATATAGIGNSNPATATTAMSSIMPTNGQTDTTADLDFDIMFNDATNADAFDLDFTTDAVNSTDPFAESAVDDFAALGNTSGGGGSEDINDLLPGLESYVNVENDASGNGGADDFSMIDIPGGDAFGENGGLGITGAGAGNASTEQIPTENSAGQNGGGNGNTGTNNVTNGAAPNGRDTIMGGADGSGDMDDIFGDMLNDIGNGDGELGNLDSLDDWFNS